jgi:phage gpG-like protein
MPPPRRLKGINVNRLRIDEGLQMRFSPSIGISARNLDKFGMDIRSFREPLKRSIQQVLAPSFRKNFDAQGRPVKWAPLAEFTVEKRGSSEPILDRSGLLKRTIQQLNIWSLDSEKAAITDLPQKIWYGKLHQAGSKGTGKATFSFPERPFVLIQGEDYDAIEEVFLKWIEERAIASKAFKPGTGR